MGRGVQLDLQRSTTGAFLCGAPRRCQRRRSRSGFPAAIAGLLLTACSASTPKDLRGEWITDGDAFARIEPLASLPAAPRESGAHLAAALFGERRWRFEPAAVEILDEFGPRRFTLEAARRKSGGLLLAGPDHAGQRLQVIVERGVSGPVILDEPRRLPLRRTDPGG